LDEVSIGVEKGSIFGLLGPNGAGKTTLLRIINQITAPDQGQLFFKGNKLKSDDIFNIGYMPEERGLYKKMKTGEQALYLAQLKGLSKQEALKRLKYWFEKFEIKGWWNKKVEELSKGMQQKIQFIITIIHEPELLIFDEPFSGFDPINTNLLKKEILEMKKKGTTIIFSTHNMASVEELCDDVCLINKAKNILAGKVKDIQSSYRSNQYELIISGDLEKTKLEIDQKFRILTSEIDDDSHLQMKIELNSQDESNELLKTVMKHGKVNSFNEILPSMNDIFIKAVAQLN
ncbi:ABC transporter ATP-binding protein, partial [Bacteroidota bacterium]